MCCHLSFDQPLFFLCLRKIVCVMKFSRDSELADGRQIIMTSILFKALVQCLKFKFRFSYMIVDLILEV